MERLKKITKGIASKINLVGDEVKFDISGDEKPPSICATLLSVIGIVAISVISFEFIQNSLDTTNPSINVEFKTLSKYPKVDLEKEGFYFALIPTAHIFSPEKVKGSRFTIHAIIWNKIYNTSDPNIRTAIKVKRFPLRTVLCSEVVDKVKYLTESETMKSLLDIAYCLVPSDDLASSYFAEGQPLDNFDASINIQIFPCSLDDPTQCASSQEVNRETFMLVYPSPDIDYSKGNKFLKWIALGDTSVEISTTNRQKFYYKFKHYSVYDQADLFSEPSKKKDFFALDDYYVYSIDRDKSIIHCPKAVIGDDDECHPYAQMTFSSSNKRERITRVYPTVVRALSEIGGFFELVVISITVLYTLYNLYFKEMKSLLLRKVFGIKRIEKDHQQYYKVIGDNLDIVEVMKELNGLKVLNRAFFKDYHLKLLPRVLSKISNREEAEESNRAKPNKKINGNPNRRGIFAESKFQKKGNQQKIYHLRKSNFNLGHGEQKNQQKEQDEDKESEPEVDEWEPKNRKTFLRRGMTIVHSPKEKSQPEFIEQLKQASTSNVLEESINRLFLKYLEEQQPSRQQRRMRPRSVEQARNRKISLNSWSSIKHNEVSSNRSIQARNVEDPNEGPPVPPSPSPHSNSGILRSFKQVRVAPKKKSSYYFRQMLSRPTKPQLPNQTDSEEDGPEGSKN